MGESRRGVFLYSSLLEERAWVHGRSYESATTNTVVDALIRGGAEGASQRNSKRGHR